MAAAVSEGLIQVPATLLLIQLPTNVSGRVVNNGPSTWVLATHVGNLIEVPGFWFQLRLALAVSPIS